MKKLSYLLICLFLAVGFAACSDDADEMNVIYKSSIEGLTEDTEVPQGEALELKAMVAPDDASIKGCPNFHFEPVYGWYVNGKKVSSAANFTFEAKEMGDYTVELKVEVDNEIQTTSSGKIHVCGKYKYGTFILNEGAVWGGDISGHLDFISRKGELTNWVVKKENEGNLLGIPAQDLFIHNNKLYIVAQNGGNAGGFLTILNAETMKIERAFESELEGKLSTPTHVAVLGDNEIYLRDNAGLWMFNPSNNELKKVENTEGVRKNTMPVVDGKVFVTQGNKILVVKGGKVIHIIEGFESAVSGVVKSSDGNLWISDGSGTISKVDAKSYKILKTNDLSDALGKDKSILSASFSATPSITAKGDTLYMSGTTSKIYRHVFSKNETRLMIDVQNVKDIVADYGVTYNTVAVHPVTGQVYFNTLKGWSDANINQLSIFDCSGDKAVLVNKYNDFEKYPAGTFFTENFR